MKKIYHFTSILILVAINYSYGQSGWSIVQSNFTDDCNSVFFANINTGWIGTDNDRIYKTTNSGSTWLYTTPSNSSINTLYFFDENSGLFGGNFGRIKKTIDGGSNWTSIVSNPELTYFRNIRFISANVGFVAYWAGGVFKTATSGNSWTSLRTTTNGCPNRTRAFSFINENTGYVMDDQNFNLSKTTNSGVNWFIVNQGLVKAFDMIFFNENDGIIACENGKILRTTNGGTNFNIINFNINDDFLDVKFVSNEIGYIVGENGIILRTTNNGINWNYQFSPTPNTLNEIFFIDQNTGWAVGTNGTIIKTVNGGVGINTLSSSIPDKFNLFQNYPNPFNPTTNIKFDIPKRSLVKLVIYNTLGEVVAMLVNVEMNAGSYQADWNASEYSSGVYFYKLVTDGFEETNRMVLLK